MIKARIGFNLSGFNEPVARAAWCIRLKLGCSFCQCLYECGLSPMKVRMNFRAFLKKKKKTLVAGTVVDTAHLHYQLLFRLENKAFYIAILGHFN